MSDFVLGDILSSRCSLIESATCDKDGVGLYSCSEERSGCFTVPWGNLHSQTWLTHMRF
jgi:hypothetical protein